ncbi:hypothetical protein [Rhodoblastus sp.]|uniref:hypothetical protein n=1 Tax=Rhodoblastus sp. TaxID=1962975 RepID=UPI003F9522D4
MAARLRGRIFPFFSGLVGGEQIATAAPIAGFAWHGGPFRLADSVVLADKKANDVNVSLDFRSDFPVVRVFTIYYVTQIKWARVVSQAKLCFVLLCASFVFAGKNKISHGVGSA